VGAWTSCPNPLKTQKSYIKKQAYLEIAQSDEMLGRYAEALASAQKVVLAVAPDPSQPLSSAMIATFMNEKMSDPTTDWVEPLVFARAEAKLGDEHSSDAIAHYDLTIADVERSARSLKIGNERESWFASLPFVYDEYIAYLADSERRHPGLGYAERALKVLESKEARVVVDEVGKSRARRFHDVPPDVVRDEDRIDRELDRAQSDLENGQSSETLLSAGQRVNDLSEKRAALLDSIKERYPSYYALRHPTPIAFDALQAALGPDEVMLLYEEFGAGGVAFIVKRDGPLRLASIPGNADIQARIRRLRGHFDALRIDHETNAPPRRIDEDSSRDAPGFARDSRELFRALVPPEVASSISGARRLIIVPADRMYGVPWEALVTNDNPLHPRYLIEDVPVSYLPSATVLALIRSTTREPGALPLLAIARPSFSTTAPAAEANLACSESAATALREPESGRFVDLPGTSVEAACIRDALHASRDALRIGDAATRESLLNLGESGQLEQYRYVLFATHAIIGGQVAGIREPALVLAHPNARTGEGFLTMADIFSLRFNADVISLSACSTGEASWWIGDGVSGLTRAFLFAGTSAVSVTLWPVEDDVELGLSPLFFAGLYRGIAPDDALRNAKLALIRSNDAHFRHPFAWAANVIFGDGAGRKAHV
jgi:CHAT domain-containing protein